MYYFPDGRPMEWKIGSRSFALQRDPSVPDRRRGRGWRRHVPGPFRVARYPWRHTPGAATLPPYQAIRQSCTVAAACTRAPSEWHRLRRSGLVDRSLPKRPR